MQLNKNGILKFWAKTSKDSNQSNAFHPLICHLIDVAVVTKKIWDEVLPAATKNRIAKDFGETDVEKVGLLIAFIAGLHDLGKCSPPFQLRGHNEKGRQTEKLLELYKDTDFWQDFPERAIDAPHGYVTAVELPKILEKKQFNHKIARQISILIGGHHGVFPSQTKLNNLTTERFIGDSNWQKARRELTESLAQLLNVKPIEQSENLKLDNGTIMIIAGLVSVADWIGSDTQFFKCKISDFTSDFELNLADYLENAEKYAETALNELGWLNWTEYKVEKNFDELFPELKKYPKRELQTQAIEISKELTKQGIVVVESPMGEGKTEAAMYLADWFNSKLNQRGIYFALPTQATSNQMFGRVEKFLENRFENGKINLQLQHGHSSLSSEFDTLKENFHNIQGVYEECSGSDCVPHVVAAEWFTYRKRGLLAPFGVGTIDQALMAVLQTKHIFVRLFGLAHKTIIIDEVHAYDAYMSTLLERLLEWLAALGSPVILLSATLPIERRNKLIEAYQKGLGVGTSDIQTAAYPRISYATDSTLKVKHIKSSAKKQTLQLEKNDEILVSDSETLNKIDENFVKNLKEKLKEGGCVAIICNTVKRSQSIYEALSKDVFFQGIDEIDGLPKLNLLHSRFRFCDRDDIEKNVRIRFGKPGDKIKVKKDGEDDEIEVKRPHCAVLVATQIIEQSLDIDFDLMISDLAPIDLLLQRAGRLHRHERTRPLTLEVPKLWVIEQKVNDLGLPNFENSIVYDKHILLRTWLCLQDSKPIEIPKDVENLIEQVYNFEKMPENLDESLLSFWQTTLADCLKSLESDDDSAKNRIIKPPSYSSHLSGIFANNLEEDSPEIHQSLQAVTRLTEPTASVICLWEKGGKDYVDEGSTEEINLNKKPYLEQTKELLRRSLTISNKSVVFEFLNEEAPKGWTESALLRRHRIIKFDENRTCRKFGHIFTLHKDLGLKITKEGEENV